MTKTRVAQRDGAQWIEEAIRQDDTIVWLAIVRADWKWKSAQHGDSWVPKRGKNGKQIRVRNAMGAYREFECGTLTINQHHNADKSALCQDGDGCWRSVKWTDLRKNWKPVTLRDFPG